MIKKVLIAVCCLFLLLVIFIFVALVSIYAVERDTGKTRVVFCQFNRLQFALRDSESFWKDPTSKANWFNHVNLDSASCGSSFVIENERIFDHSKAEILLKKADNGDFSLVRVKGLNESFFSLPELSLIHI